MTESPLMDLLIDIELLDQTAARAGLAAWTALAYGAWTATDADGMPYQIAMVN